MSDERRRRRERAADLGVIEVAVAVDDVAHGLAREARVQLVFEPRCEVDVDRIAEEYPLRRHEEDRVPVAVVRAVEILRDLRDLPGRRARRSAGRRPRLRERRRRDERAE